MISLILYSALQAFAFGQLLPKYAQDTISIEECRGIEGTKEACVWHYRFLRTQCHPQKPCSKLFIFFSDSEMSCTHKGIWSEKHPVGFLLKEYADKGYVAVCANLFESSKETAKIPYHLEKKRVALLIQNITRLAYQDQIWNGQYILFSASGHGSTALALTLNDTKLTLWGSKTWAAACLYEGNFDISKLNYFLTANIKQCNKLRAQEICERYFKSEDCPVNLNDFRHKWIHDSLVEQEVSFPIKNFQIVECGSKIKKQRCAIDGDWFPYEGMYKLCDNINRKKSYQCDWVSLSQDSHLDCAYKESSIHQCQSWFDSLIP